MSDLVIHPVVLVGGLEDSKAKPEPSDFTKLENFTVFRGRFALRAPLFLAQETGFTDDQGTPAPITHLLAAAPHESKLWVAGHSTTTQKTYLYECNADGSSPIRKAVIWATVTQVPRPVMTSFEGGTATAGTKRIYIADYDGQQITKFWDGTAINSLQLDFDNSGLVEDVKYHYVFPYQFHMWGAGFFQGTTVRGEMLRFSQPGLIPADDPDGQNSVNIGFGVGLVDWFMNDFRPVGRRGDKITNVGLAGGSMIIFKDRQTYALFGYDSQSWAIRMLTERSGAVGPYASASTGDGLCFFWAERGPHVTDGQQVIDISESVRKHVLEAEVSTEVVTAFSPDDGLVYFIYPRGGSSVPDRWLAYDKERKLWSEGEWLRQGGGILQVRHAIAIPSTALPAPVAAPSSLTVTTVDEDEQNLSWANGDIALDTVTEIYRDTVSPAVTKIASVGSGISTFTVTGLTSKTTYFYRVRHLRNNQFSGYSNEVSAKTKLARPTGFDVVSISTGNRVTMTNNEAGADIVIERRQAGQATFAALTTLLAQAAGAITFDDTTATCNIAYDYRAKVTKAGETDSEFSSTDQSFACQVSSISTCTHSVDEAAIPCWEGVISWSGTLGKPEDRIKISRNKNGAGFVEIARVSHGKLGSYRDTTLGWTGGGSNQTLQYKLEVLDGGTTIIGSPCTTTLTSHNIANCAF